MITRRVIALVLALLCVATAATAEYEIQFYVLATADPTWVRSEPGLGDNIFDRLPPDMLYEWGGHIETDGRGVDWYDVCYDSDKYGWISGLHGNLVDQYGMPYVDHSVSLGGGTSIRADSDVSVRSDAGEEYAIIGILFQGDTADYTGTSRKDGDGRTWYQINYFDNRGWVPASHTSID